MSVVRPIEHDIEQPQNHALNQITSSKMLMRILCHFPLFTDQILLEYRTHWMKHINPIVYIPTVFVYFSFLITQCGLIGLASSDGDTTTYVVRLLAVLSTIICELFFGLFCTFHFLRITGRDHQAFKVRLKKWFPFGMEDSMTVGGVFAWSLFLIARMLEGQCPPGTNLWQQQTCKYPCWNGIHSLCATMDCTTSHEMYFNSCSCRVLYVKLCRGGVLCLLYQN